jgi:hypothetical protein
MTMGFRCCSGMKCNREHTIGKAHGAICDGYAALIPLYPQEIPYFFLCWMI